MKLPYNYPIRFKSIFIESERNKKLQQFKELLISPSKCRTAKRLILTNQLVQKALPYVQYRTCMVSTDYEDSYEIIDAVESRYPECTIVRAPGAIMEKHLRSKLVVEADLPAGYVNLESRKTNLNKLLVLDNVRQPENVEMILAASREYRFDGIITLNSASFFSQRILENSRLVPLSIPVFHANERKDIFKFLRKNPSHHALVATSNTVDEPLEHCGGGLLFSSPLRKLSRFALVLSNESNGVNEEWNDFHLKRLISIPMKNNVESFGVSAAAVVLMDRLSMMRLQNTKEDNNTSENGTSKEKSLKVEITNEKEEIETNDAIKT